MELEARIETIHQKKMIGQRLEMSFANNTTGLLWKTFMPLRQTVQNTINLDLYSLQIYPPYFFENFESNRMFEKWATMEVENFDIVPRDMETLILSGGMYAVFFYRGNGNNAEETFRYILSTWLTKQSTC